MKKKNESDTQRISTNRSEHKKYEKNGRSKTNDDNAGEKAEKKTHNYGKNGFHI